MAKNFFYQEDPSSRYRLSLAQQLIGSGTQGGPVQHPLEGVGRASQALVGAYLAKQALDEQKEKRQAASDTMAQALQTGQSAKPWTDPDTGQVAPGTQPSNVMARILMGNTDTAPLGMQFQMQQMGRDQDLQTQLRLAREKQKLKPPKTRTVKRNGIEVTEQYDPATRTWTEVGQSGIGLVSPEAEEQRRRIAESGRPQNIGTIPPGYQLETTPEGATRMVPIPGSPAERKVTEAGEQEATRTEQKTRQADVVLQDIDRALKVMDEATLPTTGLTGDLLSNIGGTASRDLRGLVDTIKANVGFDRLQQMRDSSPTGGALGQVSEFENRLLQATLGNLEQSQSEEQFKFNLKRMRDIYKAIIHKGIKPGDPIIQEAGMGDEPAGSSDSGFKVRKVR